MKKLLSFLVIAGTLLPTVVKSQLAVDAHKFFGCNARHSQQIDPDFSTYFNQLTPANSGKWGLVEPEQDLMTWNILDEHYEFARDNDIPFKEHNFIWRFQQPDWLNGLSNEEIRNEAEEWIVAFTERYPEVDMIEVINEPTRHEPLYKQALGGNGETGYDWIIWAYEKARLYAPEAALILNDYDVLKNTNVRQELIEIALILKERGLIDAIGCQGHFLEGQNATSIQNALDELAQTGLDIYITELDINIANDQGQLNKYKDIFPPMWKHPAVKGVTLWGFREGEMWRDDAYLVRSDNTERPAMAWLKDFIGGKLHSAHASQSLPGLIQAEHYDTGGQYIGWFDRTTGNSGGQYRTDDVDIRQLSQENNYAVDSIENGEWLQFSLDQVTTGSYNVKLRISSATEDTANKVVFSIGGVTLDTAHIPFTGLNDTWQDITLTDVVVPVGGENHVLRLDFMGEGFTLDHFEFAPVEEQVFPLTVMYGSGQGDYTANSVVPVSADPAPEGKQFDQWTGDISYIENPGEPVTTVTMPSEEINTAAAYKSLPTYQLTITNGTGAGSYKKDTTITIKADAPEEGYEFFRWTGDTKTLEDPYDSVSTVEMPGKDIGLEAVYREETGWVTTDHTPIDDSYVRSDKPDEIYGINKDIGELNLRYRDPGGSSESIRYTLMKFDVPRHSEARSVELAILRIFGYNYSSYQNVDLEFMLAGNNWDEETVNWNNKPEFIDTSQTITISYPLLVGDFGVFEVDITELVRQNTESQLSIAIKIKDHVNDDLIKFASKENAMGASPPILKYSINESPASYQLTVDEGTGTGDYPAGTVVQIIANEPAEGYEFDQWTGDTQYIPDVLQPSTVVNMPDFSISVSASYTLSTGVEETVVESLKIFPNPADNVLTLSSSEKGTIRIYSTLSKLEKVKKIQDKFSETTINISDLPYGIYLLQFIQDDGEILKTMKFMKKQK